MQHRVSGIIIAGVALYFGFVFARAFFNSGEYVNVFVELGDATGQPIRDPADFVLHWCQFAPQLSQRFAA